MHRAGSPSVSSARKRQRLSSPTYEYQFGDLTQEDLAAVDAIEARISSFTTPKINNAVLSDDAENPFCSGFSLASKITTAKAVVDRSPSPEAPADHDYDDWFNPASADISTGFGIASFTTAASFKGLGKASVIKPSEESLAKAKARLAAWEMEDSILEGKSDVPAGSSPSKHVQIADIASFSKASHLMDKRPVLAALPNALNAPDTPVSAFLTPTAVASKVKTTSFLPPRHSAFKSPLQAAAASTFSNPSISPLKNFTTASNRHPLSGTAARPMQKENFSTPVRSRTRPAKFHTPFKPNMGPGEPGRLALPQSRNLSCSVPQKDISAALTHNPTPVRPTSRKQFFSLTPPPGRKTLATSGLKPQQYNVKEYHSLGIDVAMLKQITPDTALYYVFHGNDFRQQKLGPAEALNELHRRGCTLATKPWVDNHWCLILWKLAGMVALDPETEGVTEKKRWSWSEMIRQLLYRYERELNCGIRPPFRKIANQDVPASLPMVLCVSNIFWSPPGVTDDGVPAEPHTELELTDGWYRLRAQVDLPMARAVRNGVIKVGRKIGVAAARLSTERKDPSEILEAYNSTKLILSANSSHPVAWHTKLGFTRGPCISTLHKLDPEGGLIAALDLVIVKAHPIAFLEFIQTKDGKTERIGPRNEADELKVHEQWKKRREIEGSKLQEENEKRFRCYESYIERLEARAGKLLNVAEEGHDDTESFFDKLEYPDSAAEVLSRVTPSQAALLARRTRQHVEMGRQTAAEEMERELQESCPPREVKAFRVLIVQDSRTCRKPANRTAQLTVWNIMSLTLDEGNKPGNFAVGQRYLVSNVVPTSLSAWMDREPGSEVYLSTRRDTRWIKIKTV